MRIAIAALLPVLLSSSLAFGIEINGGGVGLDPTKVKKSGDEMTGVLGISNQLIVRDSSVTIYGHHSVSGTLTSEAGAIDGNLNIGGTLQASSVTFTTLSTNEVVHFGGTTEVINGQHTELGVFASGSSGSAMTRYGSTANKSRASSGYNENTGKYQIEFPDGTPELTVNAGTVDIPSNNLNVGGTLTANKFGTSSPITIDGNQINSVGLSIFQRDGADSFWNLSVLGTSGLHGTEKAFMIQTTFPNPQTLLKLRQDSSALIGKSSFTPTGGLQLVGQFETASVASFGHDAVGASSFTPTGRLNLGEDLHFKNGQVVRFRNAAGLGDIIALFFNSSDQLVIGATGLQGHIFNNANLQVGVIGLDGNWSVGGGSELSPDAALEVNPIPQDLFALKVSSPGASSEDMFAVDRKGLTFLKQFTQTEIEATIPSGGGGQVICIDCTLPFSICVSTGATIDGFRQESLATGVAVGCGD